MERILKFLTSAIMLLTLMASSSIANCGDLPEVKAAGVLRHLGIQPGEKIEISLLPDGKAELKAARRQGSWRELHGMLRGKGAGVRLSIEDINEAIAEAGAAAGAAGLD